MAQQPATKRYYLERYKKLKKDGTPRYGTWSVKCKADDYMKGRREDPAFREKAYDEKPTAETLKSPSHTLHTTGFDFQN